MASWQKILSAEKAADLVKAWKGSKTVVFTNGCFDILHIGHVDYLEKARNFGDKLVVGLNTDESVRRLKGPSRPVNSERSRARILAALEFVDTVILFNEDTPYELITLINPDILVKGADYDIKNIIGAEFVINNGGRVETIALTKGFSTSGIIEKISKK